MKTIIAVFLLSVLTATILFGQSSSKINYQGVLNDNGGNPVNGNRSMEFRFYTTLEGGTHLWSSGSQNVQVKQGVFNVKLGPFPVEVDFSVQYFLEVIVAGSVLTPREELGSAPRAIHSARADHAGNADRATNSDRSDRSDRADRADRSDRSDRSDRADIADAIADNTVTSPKIVDGAILFQDIGQNAATAGQVMKWNGAGWVAGDDNAGAGFSVTSVNTGSGLTGGPITSTGTVSIASGGVTSDHIADGTISNGDLSIDVISTNNLQSSSVTDAKINDVSWSKVSGAPSSFPPSGSAGGDLAGTYPNPTIANGSVTGSKIATGTILNGNLANSSITINTGTGLTGGGTVSLGGSLTIESNAAGTFLPLAGGVMSGAITNTGNPSITMGKGSFGYNNSNAGAYSFVAGSYNTAQGDFSVVSGGGGTGPIEGNSAIGHYSVVGGGKQNNTQSDYSTIAGGENNMSSGYGSAIGGGTSNITNGAQATVGGGNENAATGLGASTVGGGNGNTASGSQSTVSGGESNEASRNFATVAGGNNNTGSGLAATVSGGSYNNARGEYAVVIGGGGPDEADSNSAIGDYSTVAGGQANLANGDYSFAAGRLAKVNHRGAFVWADAGNIGSSNDFNSVGENTFNVRSRGGVYMYTHSSLTAGVTLSAGSSSWSSVSDSTMKRNIRLVDGEIILDKLSRLPIKQWSYKAQDPSIEHVGPMAQDFYEIFGLGENNVTISTIDPSGIALAAIQQLHKENELMRSELEQLKHQMQLMVEKMQANRSEQSGDANEAYEKSGMRR